MLKQSLQLKLGQQLTLTPQLQQAIRLLQLPVLDLQAEIREALESNVMLEAEEGQELDGPAAAEEPGESAQTEAEELDLEVVYANTSSVGERAGSGQGSGGDFPENRDFADRSGETLRDYLLGQLELESSDPRQMAIGMAIIDAVDDDGYLQEDLDAIAQTVRPEMEPSPAELARALAMVQRFDPPGVAARDLPECLALQMQQLPPETPGLALAQRIARHYLDLVARQQYPALRRRLRCDADALDEALALIRALHPRPGASLPGEPPEYVIPDVFVRRHEDRWIVEVNPSIAPRLRVNDAYAGSLGRGGGYEALRTQLQEARWLIRSLEIRNETLVRVAHCIVERQQAFFDRGDEAMEPMILKDVAEALGLHESTISRATTNKYMHTPRGVLEFRHFFSSHVAAVDGGEVSSTAIRARIKRLIAAENPGKPLSDSALARTLGEEGAKVARRTVAKYRESLGIPSSSERRRLASG